MAVYGSGTYGSWFYGYGATFPGDPVEAARGGGTARPPHIIVDTDTGAVSILRTSNYGGMIPDRTAVSSNLPRHAGGLIPERSAV